MVLAVAVPFLSNSHASLVMNAGGAIVIVMVMVILAVTRATVNLMMVMTLVSLMLVAAAVMVVFVICDGFVRVAVVAMVRGGPGGLRRWQCEWWWC